MVCFFNILVIIAAEAMCHWLKYPMGYCRAAETRASCLAKTLLYDEVWVAVVGGETRQACSWTLGPLDPDNKPCELDVQEAGAVNPRTLFLELVVVLLTLPALKFHNQIAYDDAYNGLATDVAEGDRLASALANKRVAILANHGVITTGPTVAHAFNDLYYLERAAQAQVIALSTGQELQRVPQDVCARTFEQMQTDRDDQSMRHLSEIKRILDKEEPDYRD